MPYELSVSQNTSPRIASFIKGFFVLVPVAGLVLLLAYSFAKDTIWIFVAWIVAVLVLAGLFGTIQYMRVKAENAELRNEAFQARRDSAAEMAQMVALYKAIAENSLATAGQLAAAKPPVKKEPTWEIQVAPTWEDMDPRDPDFERVKQKQLRERRLLEEQEEARRVADEKEYMESLQQRQKAGFRQGYMEQSPSPTLPIGAKKEVLAAKVAYFRALERSGGGQGLTIEAKFATWRRVAFRKMPDDVFYSTFNDELR